MAVATTARLFLLIPATLCSFLLVLAAADQGKAILVIHDKVRCKSDLSKIISNVPMYLVTNNAIVPGGTGRTTSDGQLLISVNLNSTEQLAALSNGSSKAYVVAPQHACGGVPKLRPGTQMAGAVEPIAMVTISGDDDGADGSIHAANNGDAAVHLNALLQNGDDSHVNGGPVHILFAKLHCLVYVNLIL